VVVYSIPPLRGQCSATSFDITESIEETMLPKFVKVTQTRAIQKPMIAIFDIRSLASHQIRFMSSNTVPNDQAVKKSWTPRVKNDNGLKSSSQMKFEMERIFMNNKVEKDVLDSFVKGNMPHFDHTSVSELMRLSVKLSKAVSVSVLDDHLHIIAARLKSLNKDGWNFKQISFVLYGLQSMDRHVDGSLDIIEIMTKIATDTLKKTPPDEQEVSMIFLGLQNMTHETEETRKLLLVMASMLNRCSNKFTSQAVGNSLYSMRGMESDCAEVRTVLKALVPKITQCITELSPQNLGNALYGLQRTHSDCSEVRAIISALGPRIKECQLTFTAQEVSNSFLGLQGMSCEYPEVRSVVRALKDRLLTCNENFTAQNIGNILYGLQTMTSEHPDVWDILSAVVPRIRICQETFTGQTVGNALYGLQGMKGDSEEARAVLKALVPRVYGCTGIVRVREISNAVYGLQGMINQLETSLLIDFLIKKMEEAISETEQLTRLPTSELFHLCQMLTLVFSDPAVSTNLAAPKWSSIMALANRELIGRRDNEDPFFTPGKVRSTNEGRVHSVVKTLLDKSKILVSFNGYLFGLFETDLVLKIPTGDSVGHFFLNIEMIGVYHKPQKRERFCAIRDRYLRSRGVIIVRADSLKLRQMDDGDLMMWLLLQIDEATKLHEKSILNNAV
jgi:hypothetical protein